MLRHVLLTLLFAPLLATTASAQAVATVCKDGSSSATSGRGACSGHGGVDTKAMKQAAKAGKAEEKATIQAAKQTGTTVLCGDGSSSKPGRGACARHGGVKTASAPVPAPVPAPLPAPAGRATPPAPAASVPASRPTPSAPTPAPRTATAPASAPASAPAAARATQGGEDANPTGAIAQCRDGMYSHAAHRTGACSRHKGVAKWL